MIYLDTHAVVWLYEKKSEEFSQKGRELIDRQALLISPIVELELEYLFEIEMISEQGRVIVNYLRRQIALSTPELSFSEVIKTAATLKWTSDPFDRIITASAALQDLPLLTKDRNIHTHYPKALW